MTKSIGRIVTLLSRNILIDLRDVIEPFGITVGEEPYYTALANEDGLSQDELTQRVCVDKSATARAVKALETKGFIRREVDSIDKRNKRLYLTEEAKSKHKSLVEALIEYNQELTSGWTKEQYDFVYQSLEMLESKFNDGTGDSQKKELNNKE